MNYQQIFDVINIGIVILDQNVHVHKWNRWMEIHSHIPAQKIIGSSLFTFFPDLENPSFIRNFKSVCKFGNFAFFSQKFHKYLFPFKPVGHLGNDFDFMQQSCTMAPLRDENNQIQFVFLMVQDVTDVAAYQKKLVELSARDGLTGAYNRRYLEKRLAEEIQRHKRLELPLSIIILDIDFFKQVNDTYGHLAGDFILKKITEFMKSHIRSIDVFARYGGEEFCCILPETPLKNAFELAESIRETIAGTPFTFGNDLISITISQGVSQLTRQSVTPKDLFRQADRALYKAKQSGRNRVICADWDL